LALLFSVGCAASFDLKKGAKLPKGEGLVCGRVVFMQGDRLLLKGPAFYVMPIDQHESEGYPINGETPFTWHLRPGRYVIVGYESAYTQEYVVYSRTTITAGRIWAEFTVEPPPAKTCLGTLVVKFAAGGTRIGVIDDCDKLELEGRDRFPTVAGGWQRNIFDLEEGP
jgi:hypothetical protein